MNRLFTHLTSCFSAGVAPSRPVRLLAALLMAILLFTQSTRLVGQCVLPTDSYPTENPSHVAIEDLNGDGKPDVVSVSESSLVSVRLGKGDGTFQNELLIPIDASTFPYVVQLSFVVTGDVNGDGKPDLIACATGLFRAIVVLLGKGDGTFGKEVEYPYPAGKKPISVAIGDFNEDNKPDLVTANYVEKSISVLLGNGDGTFQDQVVFPTLRYTYSVVTGDFNGDGKTDLAVSNFNNSYDYQPYRVSVLLGKGNGTFGEEVFYLTGEEPVSLAIGDFNGDTRPDLATANEKGNTVSVLLGKEDGTFGDQVAYATGSQPRSVATGDVNGDKKPDLVTANFEGKSLSIRYGKGDGTFGDQVVYNTGVFTQSVAIGDFTGTGKADLVFSSPNANLVGVVHQGGPSFKVTSPPPICYGQIVDLASAISNVSPAGGTFTYHWSAEDAAAGIKPFRSSVVRPLLPLPYYARYQVGDCFVVHKINIKAFPLATTPKVVSEEGHSYPGGFRALSVRQGSEPVTLVLSGCSGTLSWTGSNNTSGSSSTILVPTTAVGDYSYSVTCTLNECSSPSVQALVSVKGSTPPTSCTLTKVRFFPRSDCASCVGRTVGTQFQVSTQGPTGPWTTVATVQTETQNQWNELSIPNAPTDIKAVRFLSPDFDYGNVAEVEFYNGGDKLTGVPFSEGGGAWHDSEASFDKAFDGNTSTYYNSDNCCDAFVGLALTSCGNVTLPPVVPDGCSLSKVRIVPRPDCCAGRTIGAQIQVSMVGKEGPWTTVLTVTEEADPGSFLEFGIGDVVTGLKAVRYVSPEGGYGDVAEVQFYNGTTQLEGTYFGDASRPWNGLGDRDFDKAFDGDPTTFHDDDNASGSFIGLQLSGCDSALTARLAASAEVVWGVRVSPNPTQSQIRIQLQGMTGQTAHLQLLDATGRVLGERTHEVGGETETVSWEVRGYKAGLYFLRVLNDNRQQTLKVLKVD